MSRILLFSLLSLFTSGVSSQALKVSVDYTSELTSDNQDTICYKPGIKLSWADFQGQSPENSNEAASTSSGFAYTAQVENINEIPVLSVKVFCFFTKHNSWRRKGIEDSIHLKHEQHHFDITFLYAVKFIDEIRQTRFTYKNFGKKLSGLFKKSMAENNQLQDQYDSETSHSLDREQQKLWNGRIDSLVNKIDLSIY